MIEPNNFLHADRDKIDVLIQNNISKNSAKARKNDKSAENHHSGGLWPLRLAHNISVSAHSAFSHQRQQIAFLLGTVLTS